VSTPDWNVIATTYDQEYNEAKRLLAPFGEVRGSAYTNVLVMKVGNVFEFLDALKRQLNSDASLANAVSRIVPVTDGFRFATPEEFERNARDVVSNWESELGNRSFHVRMHRRGFKGRLLSQHEEQFIDHFLLERLEARGTPGRISFDDPDVIIAVETLGNDAGLSRWTRQQLREHELIRLD
jgi:tRNA(Ser,Leu) C12 N-acetylase TAN1